MNITAILLRRKDACAEQLYKFETLFPRGVKVTQALCIQHAQTFNWDWAAQNLLSPAARAEYKRVRATARAEYDNVKATAWAEYERTMAAAWAVHDHIRAAAWAEYDRITAPARTEYVRVLAAEFGQLAEGV